MVLSFNTVTQHENPGENKFEMYKNEIDFWRVRIIATAIVFRSFLFIQEVIGGFRLFAQRESSLFPTGFPLIPRMIIVNSAQDFAYLSWHPAYSSRNFPPY